MSWTPGCVRGFGRQALRGLSQVLFRTDGRTGALFCLALCTVDWRYGAYALGGAAFGTAAARLLGTVRERAEAGLDGLNPALFALCCAALLGPARPATALLAAGGCLVVTIATAALTHLLSVWQLPPLTAPFCLAATALTTAAPAFEQLRQPLGGTPALAAAPASAPDALQLDATARAFFHTISQILFLDRWYAGALLLAALFLANRTAGWVACAGSATGILTAWALGAPAARVADGSLGCNAVLTALALCGALLPATSATLPYALLGAATATAVTPAVAALAGGRAFTWPFVATTLGFLLAARSFPRLTAARGRRRGNPLAVRTRPRLRSAP
ncbi:urea transporter [Streptomyces griseosporeus]|uniref:urea transporter n=1 Tax=Streptomyces griseosporeus TaxID=1910 RepID=UPI00368EE5E6